LRLFFYQGIDSTEWNYEEFGPDEWAVMFKTCDGKKQSPINIIRSTTVYNKNLKRINFNNYASTYNWNVLFNNHTGQYF
jgi:carbonic anhydrase